VTSKLLFLDIDGVLNPYRAKHRLHGDWRKESMDPFRPKSLRVWVSKNLGDWLNTLTESGVRIVWATTWVMFPDDLKQYAQYLGIPNFTDRIDSDLDDLSEECGSGKMGPIERWLMSNYSSPEIPKIAWVDDEISLHERLWMEGLGGKVVITNPATGLANFKLRAEIESFFHG
jgi:hypothetical protein